jgi:CBS-domain-containing membrane protein
LFGLDARKAWQTLESKLDGMEHKLDVGTQDVTSAVTDKLNELTSAARQFLEEQSLRSPQFSAEVSTIMSHELTTCKVGDTLQRAAQLMWDHNVGALPVLGSDASLVGMLTDRDACMGCYTQGEGLEQIRVESAMSRDLTTCTPTTTIGQALGLLAHSRLNRLPVVTQEGALVGLVTLVDVVNHVYRSTGGLGMGSPAIAKAVGGSTRR